MRETARNERVQVRVIRDEPDSQLNDDWADSSPEERIEAVWMLTKICLGWNNVTTDEPRLQRTVTSLQRR